MAKVPAYHSESEHVPKQREVYHNHDDCPDGKRIFPGNRRPGTGGRPRCKACTHLG
jgi:hypothetical protein